MLLVSCPTGCGPVKRPFARRGVAVRCGNCTAWFAASPRAEDHSVVDGVLVAPPGEAPAVPVPGPRLTRVVLACALALAALIGLASAARALAPDRAAPTAR
jgi:hypothetical protein